MSKFDIEKFDGKISFAIWRLQMLAVLTQNGLKKVLAGKMMRPTTMTEEQWNKIDKRHCLQSSFACPVRCWVRSSTRKLQQEYGVNWSLYT